MADACFDAIVCECAFCTFPDKTAAAREFARVLRGGGAAGLSDLTRGPVLPKELDGLLAWMACIADAQPVESYVDYLESRRASTWRRPKRTTKRCWKWSTDPGKLLGAEIMVGLKKLDLPGVDLAAAQQMAQAAVTAIRQGALGYAIVHGVKI